MPAHVYVAGISGKDGGKSMSEYMVEVENVSKFFKQEQVLKDVNCRFERGKIHGIVGYNGSGKTVLFKCICGFLLPDGGRILVDGKEIGRELDFPGDTGMIIENPGFLPDLSGEMNLKLLASLNQKIGLSQIHEAMRKVGLDPHLKKYVRSYSLGMRQRLGIAQAIMEDPALLVLDEPFNGLDKAVTGAMHELLCTLREQRKTILLTSHNAVDIDTLCDTVWEMESGVLTRI